jgi:hypothetical protein
VNVEGRVLFDGVGGHPDDDESCGAKRFYDSIKRINEVVDDSPLSPLRASYKQVLRVRASGKSLTTPAAIFSESY